jgi:hypothetical protein
MNSVLGVDAIMRLRGFVFTGAEIEESKIKAASRLCLKHPPGSIPYQTAALKAETLRGRAKLAGRKIFPSLHPAFVLRSEVWHAVSKIDFKRIGRAVRGELKALADFGSPAVVAGNTRPLARLGRVVSLDVETTRTHSALTAKLLCVGLSDLSGKTVVLWPWRSSLAKPLSRWLRTRKAVIGHNLMTFDRVVLERHGVQ